MHKRRLLPDEVGLMPSQLKQVMQLYVAKGFEIYLVGGGVRNVISGKVPMNCDLTTNATPEENLQILKEYNPFCNNTFGTVSFDIKIGDRQELYEVTTYRTEQGYSDHRRPDQVIWGKSLEEDVVRRDFTINAIVIGMKMVSENVWGYELTDLVGGLEDFEEGVIRAVGNPEERFGEDALRMMRSIRFAATLGFEIESRTLAAIGNKADLLSNISKERVRDEFFRILEANYPADGVRLLITTGLLTGFLPELLEGREVRQGGHHTLSVLEHLLTALKECPSTDPVVRLATLIHDIGKPRSQRFRCRKCRKMYRNIVEELVTCPNCGFVQPSREMITFYGHEVIGARMAREIGERLRLSGKQAEKLEGLVRWHMFNYQPNMTDAAIRRMIRKIGKENINDMIMLRIADRKGSGSKTTSWRFMELQKRIGEQLFEPMEIRDMVVDGGDVMKELSIGPGPLVGEVLKKLFDEVMEETSRNDRDYLVRRIREIGQERQEYTKNND